MEKIKLFTHTDLDGAGCAVVLNCYNNRFSNELDIEYLDHNIVEGRLNEFIDSNEYLNYNYIYVTDLSFSLELADKLDNILYDKTFKLFDHHVTALPLNKYSWANINTGTTDIPCCGTSLFADYLRIRYNITWNSTESLFITAVTMWDTWQWKKLEYKVVGTVAKDLNTIFRIKNCRHFVRDIIKQIDSKELFTEIERIIINVCEQQTSNYIEDRKKSVIEYLYGGESWGLVFAENNISELGNTICVEHPEFKGVFIVTPHGVSIRTDRHDVDVSEIAKKFGGGGHKKAAGITISDRDKRIILDTIIGEEPQNDN